MTFTPHRRSRRAWFALAPAIALGLALSPSSCATLPTLQAGTCGNGVIDSTEDCDAFPAGQCIAPGALNACRLSCGDALACPAGWGCGVDAVCRRPSGSFERAGDPQPAAAWRASIGDFDGDGRKDVLTRGLIDALGVSRARIHFFGEGAAPVAINFIAPEVSFPVVANVDGDDTDDLIFASTGIVVMLGQSDRSLLPVAYPSYELDKTKALTIALNAPGGEARLATMARATAGGPTAILRGERDGTFPILVANIGDIDALAGKFVIADFNEDPTTCDEFVLAFKDANEVTLYTPCKFDPVKKVSAWNTGASPQKIALPPGARVDAGVRVAKLNADAHWDLMIGASGKAYFAYGNGDGTFRANADPLKPGAANSASEVFSPNVLAVDGRSIMSAPAPRLPLAARDITGDGIVDFVMPQQIYLSTTFVNDLGVSLPAYTATFSKTRGEWTEALIDDFNGNGHLDIAAISAADLAIDFFSGASTPALSPFSISTNGPLSNLVAGDVDGDRIADLVFSQASSVGGPDETLIAFGRPNTVPASPITVGRFEKTLQISTIATAPSYAPRSVIVVSTPQASPNSVTRLAVLIGSPDRQPLAPLLLANGPTGKDGVPIALAAGKLSSNAIDVLTVAGDSPDATQNVALDTFRMWVLAGQGNAGFAKPSPVPTALNADLGLRLGKGAPPILLGTVDSDRDGTFEAVGLAPYGTEARTALVVTRPARAGAGWSVAMPVPVIFEKTIAQEGQLLVADADGDGSDDLVVLFGAPEGTREIVVVWNDGKGNFAADRTTTLVTGQGADTPNGVDAVRVGLGGPKALAYVTRTGLFVATFDGASRTFKPQKITSLLRGTGVAAGDVDGDGVDDLAVVDATNLAIYRGKPVLQ